MGLELTMNCVERYIKTCGRGKQLIF